MLRLDNCQPPFGDTCNKAAFTLAVPACLLEVHSGSGLHYTTPARIRGSAEHIHFFQYAMLGTTVLLISGVFLQSNGLCKVSVNLMVHTNTFLENKY